MWLVITCVALLALAIVAPKAWRAVEIFIMAPLLGIPAAGILWALLAMVFPQLISFVVFGCFALVGVIAAEIVLAKIL